MPLCTFHTQTHQTRRHPGVPAAEPGLVADVLTQRETAHSVQGLCEGTQMEILGAK